MSMTLKLVDNLLARGRKLHELGRPQDAYQLLDQLSRFRQLPGDVAEETQVRLAEICLGRKQFKRARRHLTAALRYAPDSPRHHYLMATAFEGDDRGDTDRAMTHYRRSLRQEPDQVECLCDFGLLAIREGRVEEGLKALRRATELGPDDVDALQCLVKGLSEACRSDEARKALQAAIFRNPRDSRFRKLWNDFQFHALREAQAASREWSGTTEQEDKPVILPFVRMLGGTKRAPVPGKVIRYDGPGPGTGGLKPPAGRRQPSTRRADQKHAQ